MPEENKSIIIFSRYDVDGALTILGASLPTWCKPLLRKQSDGTYKTIIREDCEQEIFVLPLCLRSGSERKVVCLPSIPLKT